MKGGLLLQWSYSCWWRWPSFLIQLSYCSFVVLRSLKRASDATRSYARRYCLCKTHLCNLIIKHFYPITKYKTKFNSNLKIWNYYDPNLLEQLISIIMMTKNKLFSYSFWKFIRKVCWNVKLLTSSFGFIVNCRCERDRDF